MKNEIEKFIDLEPVMDKKAFIELLLLVLAEENVVYDIKTNGNTRMAIDSKERLAYLPFNYKEGIASALKSGSSNFIKLLDIRQFNDNQKCFEVELNSALEYYLNVIRSHDYSISFDKDAIVVPYTKEAIDTLIKKYDSDLVTSARDISWEIKCNYDEKSSDLEKQVECKSLILNRKIEEINNRTLLDIIEDKLEYQKTKRKK